MSKEVLASQSDQFHQTKTAEYNGGKVGYSIFGDPNSELQKILVIPGFTEDSVTMQGFAEALTDGGQRQVIVTDQPSLKFKEGFTMPIIDHQAKANLAVISAEGLDDEPLAVVAHSMGAPIEVRMAKLAKERGIKALDTNEGSVSLFLAPAGANPDERLLLSRDSLASRFIFKFMSRDAKENKKFDPEGIGKKRAAKNFVGNPLKTWKETWYLSKKESTYSKLGELGLKPAVVVFPDDVLQPQRLNQKTTEAYVSGEADYSLSGWSSAIGSLRTGTGEGENAWLDDYRHAGHNDHARHPEDVAKLVLSIFDHRMDPRNVDHIVEANRKYLQNKEAA